MSAVLIIENDQKLRETMLESVRLTASAVSTCRTLAEAYDHLERKQFAVVVVDRVLNDGDGLELVQYLRDVKFATRVLILSQLGDVEQRVLGLEYGADDYLPKPFSLAELKLRIQVLLNREKRLPGTWLRLGAVQLNPETGCVLLGEDTCRLRRREAQILACLLRYQNQVLSRDRLIELVWQDELEPTYTTLDVYVRRLRVLLGAHSSIIRTIRGFGYMASER